MGGKSYSAEYPIGRRAGRAGLGKAPKSLRKIGKRYLSDCSDEELARALNCEIAALSLDDMENLGKLKAANMI